MKNQVLLLTSFLLSISSFSQTFSDRSKIVSTYDVEKIGKFQNDLFTFNQAQKTLKDQYRLLNPFIESELKSLQYIIDGIPYFFSIDNQGSASTIGVDRLYLNGGLGINLSGSGITCGVWDGGLVRETHQELNNLKITFGADGNDPLSNHATHVTGTIIGRGVSPTRRGMAYDGQAITHNFNDDVFEMFTFASGGYLVSNHSYGLIASGLTAARFGQYDALAVQMDNLSNTFPFYQIVLAAGNDRDNTALAQVGLKGGYDLLTGRNTAKNIIVVAAVADVPLYLNSSSVLMSTFSNFGPTDDGRIKPDISARGLAVSSSSSAGDTAYSTLQGTSMAAPSISGMIMLLQQHFNNLNPTNFMRASTVRGLICHTAREAGFERGPDYEFGWGLANAELSAIIISGRGVSTVLEENTLNNGQIFTKQFSISSQQNIAATICWTDPTGVANSPAQVDNRLPRLVNNLDLKILRNGVTYYPWKLNPDIPTDPATNDSDNEVDNVEKVEILNAPPGVYTIEVRHKGTLSGGSQNFSLIANGRNVLSLNTRDYDLVDNIFIYPNPTTDVLNFSLKNDVVISSIKINDIFGKEVFSNNNIIETAPIDVANLSSGVYFVTFTTDSNSVTKKFIKQ